MMRFNIYIEMILSGDRIVAINGQSLLNLCYDESLKLLQSTSKSVVLVLSQVAKKDMVHLHSRKNAIQKTYDNHYYK